MYEMDAAKLNQLRRFYVPCSPVKKEQGDRIAA
jgi:hypothetical protein